MSQQNLENFIPPIQSDGLNTATNTLLGGTLTVTGATTHNGATTFATTATFQGVVNGIRQNIVDVTANTTLTAAQSGSVVMFDVATGAQARLPAPSTGLTYEFIVKTALASGSYGIRTNSGSVFLVGGLATNQSITATVPNFFGADGSTIILTNMNGTTTGGSLGTVFYATAVSTTQWLVSGQSVGSGILATPFSST